FAGGVHDGDGLAVNELGDGDAVTGLDPAAGHGPRAAWVGMDRSATTGCGARSSGMSRATGSRSCMAAVVSTLASTCQVSAPARVRLPPQLLRHTTAGRMACSARQLVACTPGVVRNVNRALRSRPRWLSSLRLGGYRVRPATSLSTAAP